MGSVHNGNEGKNWILDPNPDLFLMNPSQEMIAHIALIGPVLPFRGGIAQHLTMLHRTLRNKANLTTVSFKRQYPGFLYPGQSNVEPGYDGYREPDVLYLLDSINPLTWYQVVRLVTECAPNLVIIPWWTSFWGPCFAFIANYLKYRRIQLMFLCHNVVGHNPAFWKLKIMRMILSRADFLMVDNHHNASALTRLLPQAQIVVHPVPPFTQFPPPKGLLTRRSSLELLFFGFVRPYKGLDVLLKAMILLKDKDVSLTIAGEWWKHDRALRTLIEREDLREKIEVVNKYLTKEEVAEYFFRADVVVLPYRSASGTGVIPLAYYYGKPVIVTRVGGLPDSVDDGIHGRLVEPEDPRALAQVILEFLERSSLACEQQTKPTTKYGTWESLVRCILKTLERKTRPGISL